MSSMADSEIRLLNLQQYIPFLQKMVERLATSSDGSKLAQRSKMLQLLEVITCSGLKQFVPYPTNPPSR